MRGRPRQQHVLAAGRATETHAEQLVVLGQHADIRGLLGTHRVSPHLIRSVRVVLRGIVHLGVAAAPADAPRRFLDDIREVLARDVAAAASCILKALFFRNRLHLTTR